MDRRSFLRFLGAGTAAAVAAPIIKPKSFFSFFGTGQVWKPEPVWTYELQGSMDLVNWSADFAFPRLLVQPISGGVWDGLSIVTKDDILDVGGFKELGPRYLRVVCTGGPTVGEQRFSVSPIT